MSEPVIKLPVSKLYVEGGSLEKRTSQGEVIGKYPLVEILNLSLLARTNIIPIIVSLLFGAGAALCYLQVSAALLSWSLTIFLGLIAIVSLVFIRKRAVVIETAVGKVELELLDPADDCQAFLLSLRQMIEQEKIRKLEQ